MRSEALARLSVLVALLVTRCSVSEEPNQGTGNDDMSLAGGAGEIVNGTAGADSVPGGVGGASTSGVSGGMNAAGGSKTPMGSGGAGGSGGSGGSIGTSGSGGASGAAGGGGTPVIDPGSCPTLPSNGTWKNVTPPGAASVGSRALAIRPDRPATIYSGSDGAGIFRSTDCGATWAIAHTGAHSKDMSSGSSWSLKIDPVVPDTMYAVVGYGSVGLWKSTNAGVDWNNVLTDSKVTSAIYAGGFLMGVDIDRTDHNHLVIASHGTCSTGHPCGAESRDSGATWTLFDIAAAGGWSENSTVAIVTPTTWLYCALFDGMYGTTDRGVSWSKLDVGGTLPSCNYYNPSVWQAADGRYYVAGIAFTGSGLIQSQPNDPTKWSVVANGPQGTALIPTKNHLIVSRFQGSTVYIAPQNNPTQWTKLTDSAGSFLAYDGTHQVLYVSRSSQGGLWQIVTD